MIAYLTQEEQAGTTVTEDNRRRSTTSSPSHQREAKPILNDTNDNLIGVAKNNSNNKGNGNRNGNGNGNSNGNKANGRSWKDKERPYRRRREIEFINDLDLGVEFKNVNQRKKLRDEEKRKQREEGGNRRMADEEPFAEPSVSASIREEFLYLFSSIEP